MIEIILLEDITGLGFAGDLVHVKNGHARNFLLPTKKAQEATPDNRAEITALQKEFAEKALAHKQQAESVLSTIDEKTVVIRARVGEEGKLYGSVGTIDIVTAISEQLGTTVERKHIRLPNGNIRATGEHIVHIDLYRDVQATLTIQVAAQDDTINDDRE